MITLFVFPSPCSCTYLIMFLLVSFAVRMARLWTRALILGRRLSAYFCAFLALSCLLSWLGICRYSFLALHQEICLDQQIILLFLVKTYLQSMTVRLEEWRIKRRDTEEWMRHRQLPPDLQERVRRFEQYRWLTTRGVNEESILRSLPLDLRREIQRHLCLNLVRRVSVLLRPSFLKFIIVLFLICFFV